jgi:hypothetical protein
VLRQPLQPHNNPQPYTCSSNGFTLKALTDDQASTSFVRSD